MVKRLKSYNKVHKSIMREEGSGNLGKSYNRFIKSIF